MDSYKTQSRIITITVTIILGIITYISTMNPSDLANQLGVYGSYASFIIVICASIVNHYSEEKRVTRAEEIIEHNYTKLGYPKKATIDELDNAIKEIQKEDEQKIKEKEYNDNIKEVDTQ